MKVVFPVEKDEEITSPKLHPKDMDSKSKVNKLLDICDLCGEKSYDRTRYRDSKGVLLATVCTHHYSEAPNTTKKFLESKIK